MTSIQDVNDESMGAFDPATQELIKQEQQRAPAPAPAAPQPEPSLAYKIGSGIRSAITAPMPSLEEAQGMNAAGGRIINGVVGAVGDVAGGLFGATPAQAAEQPVAGGQIAPGAGPQPVKPVMVGQSPQPPGAQPQQPGGAGGGGYGIGTAQNMAAKSEAEARAANEQTYKQKEKALADARDLGEQKAAEEAALMRQQSVEIEKHNAMVATHEQERAAAADEHIARSEQLNREAGDGKVNFNRMFQHEDGSTDYGSTVLASIAIAFGALGQAMTHGSTNGALQIINDKINRDVAEQREDYQRKRDKVTAEDNLWAKVREKFHDDRATEAAAKNMLIEKHQDALKTLAQEYAAPEKQIQFEQGQAALAEEKAKNNQIIAESAIAHKNQEIAQRMNAEQIGIQRDSALMQRMAALQKAQANGEKLPAAQAQALADLQTAQKLTQSLRDKPNQASSFFSKFVPGTTEADEYNRRANTLGQMVGTSLEGGKLTDSDFENKYKPLVPRATDSEGTKNRKLADLDKLLAEKGKSLADIFGQQGYAIPQTEAQASARQNQGLAALVGGR